MNIQNCCGCSACLHICPENCITMKEDIEGFLYPMINEGKCIHCHKCERVCPIQHTDKKNTKTETYVGYSRNEIVRKQSSSGGIFSVIAEWILQQEGVVFGAAFDENFEVRHIAVERIEDLEQLRGSKYVESRLDDVFPTVEQYLDQKRKVLFSGTACQIAGLKNYLNKEYEHLYTVDVLCHGVPAPRIWRIYIEEKKKEYQETIERVEFRNKENGWKKYKMNVIFSDSKQYCVPYYEDKYMGMFLGNLDLRSSCYACRFKDFPRMSDMTVGDSWGIERYMPELDDDKGCSVILVHSPKGEVMLESIGEQLIVREAMLDKVLPVRGDSRKSVEMHPNRNKYLEGLKNGEDFETLYGYVRKNIRQKVGSFIRYFVK